MFKGDDEVNNPNVSVIICTYHSANEKLKRTINSVSCQHGVKYEVIITDDGSEDFDLPSVENLLNRIERHIIIHNEKNVGTVNNLYTALRKCNGEYVFCLSPGDIMYSDDTLYRLYQEVVNAEETILFGNAVWYWIKKKEIQIIPVDEPRMPKLYNQKCKSYLIPLLSYYYMNRPVGVTYLRKREVFIKYMEMMREEIKFVEDSTTTLLYLLDGGRMKYLDIPVVWYEYGAGISTSKNEKWTKILKQDFEKLEEMLKQRYSNTDFVKCVYGEENQSMSDSVRYSMMKLLLTILKKIGKLTNRIGKKVDVANLKKQLEENI